MPAGTRIDRFRLDISATGADKVRREVADLNRENARMRETAGGAAAATSSLTAAGHQVAAAMNAAAGQQNKMGIALAGTNEKIRAQAAAMQLSYSAAKLHGREMIELGSATERTARQVERASLAWQQYRASAAGAIAAGRATPWAPGQGRAEAAAGSGGGRGARLGLFGAASAVTATLGVGYLGLRGIQLLGEYEEAALSLEKVLKGTAAEQEQVVKNINALALVLPATRKELLAMAAAGAQMGIANKALDEFTESFTRLDSAADTIGVGDALQFGQVQSFLKGTKVGFEELAGIIVELGNTLPATERDILEMLHQVSGGLGTIRREAGLSGADVAGISGALASAGAEPGSARRTMREFFTALVMAQNGATEEMKAFVSVTGVAEERLKEMSSAEVLGRFIQGVNKLGVGSQKFMDVLQLDGKRAAAVLAALSLRVDEFWKGVSSATTQAENGGQAAIAESEKKFGSMLARLEVAWNAINTWATAEEASTGRNILATVGEVIAVPFSDDKTVLQFRERWRDQHEPGTFGYNNQQRQIELLKARMDANRPAGWRWSELGQGGAPVPDFAARSEAQAGSQRIIDVSGDFSVNPFAPTEIGAINAEQDALLGTAAARQAFARQRVAAQIADNGARNRREAATRRARFLFDAQRQAAYSGDAHRRRAFLASAENFAADRRGAFRDSFGRPVIAHDDLTFGAEQGSPLDAFRQGITGLDEELTDGEKTLMRFKEAGTQMRRATDQLVAGLFDASQSFGDILNNIIQQWAQNQLQEAAGSVLDYIAPVIVGGLNGAGAGAGAAQATSARGPGRRRIGAPNVVVNVGGDTSRADQIRLTQAVTAGTLRASQERAAVDAGLGR